MTFTDIGIINRYEKEHNKIFWNWAWFINQNLPLIYAYYNNNNVQFKRYIFRMLVGRMHRIRFEESSLFIILSWIGRRKILKLSSVTYHISYIIGRWSEYFLESWNKWCFWWRNWKYSNKELFRSGFIINLNLVLIWIFLIWLEKKSIISYNIHFLLNLKPSLRNACLEKLLW